jgi:hypothetical protein
MAFMTLRHAIALNESEFREVSHFPNVMDVCRQLPMLRTRPRVLPVPMLVASSAHRMGSEERLPESLPRAMPVIATLIGVPASSIVLTCLS